MSTCMQIALTGLSLLLPAAIAAGATARPVESPSVLLLKHIPAEGAPADVRKNVEDYLGRIRGRLSAMGIGVEVVGDSDLAEGTLRDARLVILPYNPTVPPAAEALLESFVRNGGKIILFYNGSTRLLNLVGINRVTYVGGARLGTIAGFRFVGEAPEGRPGFVAQKSWNIFEPTLDPRGGARTAATWETVDGADTGRPAVVLHPNGAAVTHVYLDADPEAGGRFLLSLTGSAVPDVWRAAAASRLSGAGVFRDYPDADALGPDAAKVPAASRALDAARRSLAIAGDAFKAEDYAAAYDAAGDARKAAGEAYLLSRPSRAGELRGAWIHSGYGLGDWGWDKTIRVLKENGFNAIFPNMCWGAVADYPSAVLPVHPRVATDGDQIAACLEACRKYGVQLHVWKVNWNMGHHTPESVARDMREAGRVQVNADGEATLFLAPHVAENFRMERDAMLEIVRKYPVDGIHFDYIRYPHGESDFSASARAAFEADIGRKVDAWPQDCLNGGILRDEFNRWRRDNITRLVREVSREAHAIRPDVSVSAAVFGGWDSAPDTVAQAAEQWIDEGLLDFICPMDYFDSNDTLERLLRRQIGAVRGRIPFYPGIGSWKHASPTRTAEQIEMIRAMGGDGFVCFSHNPRFAEDFLPPLGRGIAAEPAGLLPHNSPRPDFSVPEGREELGGDFALRETVEVVADLAKLDGTLTPAVTLTRDGIPVGAGRRLEVVETRDRVRCIVRPDEPGTYRIELRGLLVRGRRGPGVNVLARSRPFRVLSREQEQEAILRSGPPAFGGMGGIRVAVWQNDAYGAGPILAALAEDPALDVAPLYNLKADSLKAADVVILPQPRSEIARFRDEATMATVRDFMTGGGGVMVTHALVGVRGFVTPAPEVATGGAALSGNGWRITKTNPITEGLRNTVYESTFSDRIEVVPGRSGTVLAATEDGRPVVASGRVGLGRFVACGLGIGIAAGDEDAPLSDAERALLTNAARWLNGNGRRRR